VGGATAATTQNAPEATTRPVTRIVQDTAGIGVALGRDGDNLVIEKVLPGTPAAISGLLYPHDQIVQIAEGDGLPKKVNGHELTEAVRMLKGPSGTVVHLTMSGAQIVSIVRAQFKGLWGDGKLLPPGTAAPDASFTSLPGDEPVHLADYRGKIVLLAFWARWCGPCQDEIAALQTLPGKHPEWNGKVVLITASVDENRDAAVKRLAEKGWIKTRNLWTDEKTIRLFHFDGIPTTYIIDTNGNVAAADPRDAVEAVETLLLRR